jgi:methylthioribose-1-phosphate isomerase
MISEKLIFTDSFELKMLDVSLLPFREKILKAKHHKDVLDWITQGRIKGTSLLASAALYSVVMAVASHETKNKKNLEIKLARLAENFIGLDKLNKTLDHALILVTKNFIEWSGEENENITDLMLRCADEFYDAEAEMNNKIAVNSIDLFPEAATIITLGNWGDYSACGIGTAHGAIKKAAGSAKQVYVYLCETRPSFNGSRIAAYDFETNEIDFEIIPDTNAAVLMNDKIADMVITGSYLTACNGDTLCDPGSLNLALLCKYFGLPFYIALTGSAIDFKRADLNELTIPENNPVDIYQADETLITKKQYNSYNPAFDIIPGEFISGIITENKVHFPPYKFQEISHLFRSFIQAGNDI